MKKGLCFLLILFTYFSLLAKPRVPLPPVDDTGLVTPIDFSLHNKAAAFYLPNACGGLINDVLAGDATISVVAQGKIQNGRLSVQVKVDLKGKAITTVGGTQYIVSGTLLSSEVKTIGAEPVDVFVKGTLKLAGREKEPDLYIGDIGYITIYADGSVASHILDGTNDPAYSHPKVFCREE